jgi:RP/EB family microtubule-associated protein
MPKLPAQIEHLCDGIAYCQIVDALYPRKIPLHKLNFKARGQIECLHNLRIVQRAFKSCDIDKEVPVDNLSKGSFQDNCEFLQWCYAFVCKKYPDAIVAYEALARRQAAAAYQVLRESQRRPSRSPEGRDSLTSRIRADY